ncbi:MAG TPA: hypothetical protein VGI28_16730 [Stellaceae bacterium]
MLFAATAAKAQAPAPPAAPAPLPPPPRPAEEESQLAQHPPPGQEQPPGRTFCDESVAYHLADPVSVPEQYRRFVGVWSDAAWDAKICAALIVEDVKPDGAASIVYVYGPEGSNSTVQGAVLHGTGVIRGDQLRFQNSDGSQYAFRPGLVDMIGHWINPRGESFQATFKSTP